MLHGNPGFECPRGHRAAIEMAADASYLQQDVTTNAKYRSLAFGVLLLIQQWSAKQRRAISQKVAASTISGDGGNGVTAAHKPLTVFSPTAAAAAGGGAASPSLSPTSLAARRGLGEEIRLNAAYDVELELFSDDDDEVDEGGIGEGGREQEAVGEDGGAGGGWKGRVVNKFHQSSVRNGGGSGGGAGGNKRRDSLEFAIPSPGFAPNAKVFDFAGQLGAR